MPDFIDTKGLTAEALDAEQAKLEDQIKQAEEASVTTTTPVKETPVAAKNNAVEKAVAGVNRVALSFGRPLFGPKKPIVNAQETRVDIMNPFAKKAFTGPRLTPEARKAGRKLNVKPTSLMPSQTAQLMNQSVGATLKKLRDKKLRVDLDIKGGGNLTKDCEITTGKEVDRNMILSAGLDVAGS